MVVIRPAAEADAPALGFVHYHAWCETYAGQIDAAYLAKGSPEKSAAGFLRNGCRDLLLAEADGAPIGFAGYSLSRDADASPACGELDAVYVLRSHQGLGVGTRLMEAAFQALRDRGCREVTLWVLATNAQAIGFYRHRGFQPDGSEKMLTLGQPVPVCRFRMLL